MRVSQKLSQIPGVSSSRIFMEGLLGVSISFFNAKEVSGSQKMYQSRRLAFTIRHPLILVSKFLVRDKSWNADWLNWTAE